MDKEMETPRTERIESEHLHQLLSWMDLRGTDKGDKEVPMSKQETLAIQTKEDAKFLETVAFYYWVKEHTPAGQPLTKQVIREITTRYPEFINQLSTEGKTLHDADSVKTCLVWLLNTARDCLDDSTETEVRLIDALIHFGLYSVEEDFESWKYHVLGKPIVRRKKIAPVADAFENDEGTIPSNPLLTGALEAVWSGGGDARTLMRGWRENAARRPVFIYDEMKHGRITAYLNGTNRANASMLDTEGAWSCIEQMSPFTGDVILAVLAQICDPSTQDRSKGPVREPVRITARAILDYKGMNQRGKEAKNLEIRIAKQMELLRHLYFDIQKLPGRNPKTGEWDSHGVTLEGDRLFDIVRVDEYQEDLFGEKTNIGMSWFVRPGLWANHWLNTEGTMWIGKLARRLLTYRHTNHAFTKKIGQRLTLLHNIRHKTKFQPLYLRISTILSSVGELPEASNRTKNWPRRTRDNFEQALMRLQEDGIISSVEWEGGYGPGEGRRTKGWVEKWLESKVTIQMTMKALTLEDDTTPALLPSVDDDMFSHKEMKNRRHEKQWTQKSLADHLGISNAYVSQIENGKRIPGPDLAARIISWMKSPT